MGDSNMAEIKCQHFIAKDKVDALNKKGSDT